MDRLQTMKTFTKVVDEGGFAAAARALDVDQALVTRQVADLERHLGVKLLERTTRSMRLTEAGETFLTRSRQILSEMAEAEALVSRSQQDMKGRVRVAVPTLFGAEGVAQHLAQLHAQHPDLSCEVAMLDRAVDPVAEGFDVVVQDATLGASALAVARPLLEVPFLLCASPQYLQGHAALERPADLVSHHCVTGWVPGWGTGDGSPAQERWSLLHEDGRKESVEMRVALRSNTQTLNLEAVRQGLGVGRMSPRMLAADLEHGRLMQVLPGWQAGSVAFNLVYPSRRLMPRRVRHVIDAIVGKCDALRDLH
jgi:DNA-binding transcriptional LysR family regulator